MSKRRDFLKLAGLTGLALTQGSMIPGSASANSGQDELNDGSSLTGADEDADLSIHSPNDDLDEGETARLGEDKTDLV